MGRALFLSVVFLNDLYYLKNALVSIAITIFIMCMIEKK